MKNGCFDLTSNAFHILKAGYDANRSDIAELFEDAEFDEVFESYKIQRAQQSLLAPNARLEQEISWLPELSRTQTSSVLNLVASGDLEALIETSKHTPELAKANILAHFAGSRNVNDNLLHTLVTAWDEIDEANIITFINENRLIAGFPRVEPQHLHRALVELEKQHARSAAVGIWRLDRPGAVMDRFVEAELKMHPSSSFLEQFVRNYDTLSEPDLARISDEIDDLIDLANEGNANLGAIVSAFSHKLTKWDEVNQPVQVYEQHQGHEEGRSKRIYEKLRSLCLDLANNRNEFAEARRLSEALLRTFPELESVAEVLKEDVATLENLDEQQKLHAKYKVLIDECEAAKTKLPTPVSNVLRVFRDTVSRGGDALIALNIVRDLVLHINNVSNDPQTAFRLLDGVLTFAGARLPQEIGETIEEERAVLHRNWKMNELEKNSGNLTAMSQTVEDLLKFARGPERVELQKLKTKLDRKRLGKKVKWGIYASIAAVIGFFVIADEMDNPSNRSTYQPSVPRIATPTPTTSAAVETRPPVGQGITLNRSQVRYCVFQGQRLDIIRTLTTTDYQIDRFNALIGDFNSRCSNFRYRSGDLSAAELEARESAPDLRADARRIVSSW